MGNLVLTGATSGSATVQATDAATVTITLPSSTGTLASTGANTFTADQTINGLTVGRGAANVATNTALGAYALQANTTGYYDVAIGSSALGTNTTGQYNVAVGTQALYVNTTGLGNTAIGDRTLTSNTTANYNTAIGANSLGANTTGTGNTGIGQASLYLTTTGNYNSALGQGALQNNTTASYNTAVGYQALYTNGTAGYSTAVGYQALYASTARNTAYGAFAAYQTTTGNANTAIGDNALQTNVSGQYNTAIGYQALNSSTSNVNTAIGYQAGYNLATGANNVFIGYYTRLSGSADAQCMVISTNSGGSVGKGSNTGFIDANGGGGSVYQGNNSSSWATTSDQRLKKNIVDNTTGLDLISQIRVRNFEYRLPEEVDAELSPNDAIDLKGVQLGVIAQEIAEVSQEFVKTESTGVMSVDSDNLTWYLINAVKELNAKVTALEAQLGAK